jgi:hypothetical protein
MTVRGPSLLLCALLLACSAVQRPWSGKAYCEASAADAAREDAWQRLLLKGWDPETRRVTTPALDCTSEIVRWDAPAQACFDGTLASTALPSRPIADRDVVVSPVGEGFSLVWVPTTRYASGDALGPVALVEEKGGRRVVRATGALRAYPEKAALRFEQLGALWVMVAEGQLCAGADPAGCVRAARVMPLRGDRFSAEPLFSEAGACVAPAWFDLVRQDEDRLPSGWTRRNQLAASLVFSPAGLRVEEQLLVHDRDPRHPEAQPRLHRKAQGDRTVTAQGGRLVVTGRSLWATGQDGGGGT